MARFSDLPPELHSAVLNFLSDLGDLKATCLVCRSLRLPSQAHMFNTVVLRPQGRNEKTGNPDISFGRRTCPIFHNLLQDAPHIAHYVRKLVVIEGLAPGFAESATNWYMFNSQHPSSCCWLELEPTFPLVLNKLNKLTVLDIRTEHTDEGILWHDLSPTLRSTLLDAIRKPSLKSVRVSWQMGASIPSEVFKDVPFTAMRLSSDHQTTILPAPQVAAFTRPELRSLVLIDVLNHGALEWLHSKTSPVFANRLENLSTICSNAGDQVPAIRLIEMNSTSLKSLSICPNTESYINLTTLGLQDLSLEPWKLPFLPSLKHLRIRINVFLVGFITPPRPVLWWIVRLLIESDSYPSLLAFSLYLVPNAFDGVTDESVFADLRTLGWEAFAAILSDKERFPRLNRVEINLGRGRDDDYDTFAHVPSFLYRLDERHGRAIKEALSDLGTTLTLEVFDVKNIMHVFRRDADSFEGID